MQFFCLSVILPLDKTVLSSWERDQFQPSMDNLQKLAELFQIPIDTLLSDTDPQWLYREKLFDENHMYTFLKAKFQTLELSQALACLAFAREKHHGQIRKGDANIPYISHPLTMACHALAMGIVDDDVLASLLLHDVVEDTGTSLDELPANERVRKAVSLVSYNTYSGSKEQIRSIYYKNIKENPLACLIKCIDRCNNLSCMASGFTKKKMASCVGDQVTFPGGVMKRYYLFELGFSVVMVDNGIYRFL